MISVEDAQSRILSQIHPGPQIETVSLADAVGRVLADDILSPMAVPPFTNTSMDGYAVIADDTASATAEQPVRLRNLGTVSAGHPVQDAVTPGTCWKIMTGAPVPPGADAVVPVEWTQTQSDGQVLIFRPVTPGAHLRWAGEDFQPGQPALSRGTRLSPPQVGILATLGWAEIPVARRPRIAILATGDELREPGQPLPAGTIHNSNSYALLAAVKEAGGEPIMFPPAPDRLDAIRETIRQAQAEADLIISSGGVSVGDFDLVKAVIEELGELTFWRVNVKPGKPVAFGRVGSVPVLGLPGNPVSALVTFELFVRPIIRRWLGDDQWQRPVVKLPLYRPFTEITDRRHYVRSRLVIEDGHLGLWPHSNQGSAVQSSWADVDALMIVPEHTGPYQRGEELPAMLLGLTALHAAHIDQNRKNP